MAGKALPGAVGWQRELRCKFYRAPFDEKRADSSKGDELDPGPAESSGGRHKDSGQGERARIRSAEIGGSLSE